MRFWFRLFGWDEQALKLPVIRKEKKLSKVLSKEECKQLFGAPHSMKHRFLLVFAYSARLRMNELHHSTFTWAQLVANYANLSSYRAGYSQDRQKSS